MGIPMKNSLLLQKLAGGFKLPKTFRDLGLILGKPAVKTVGEKIQNQQNFLGRIMSGFHIVSDGGLISPVFKIRIRMLLQVLLHLGRE